MDIPQIVAGRFRIECELGRGGMGTVYRATHLGLERPVAIKVLKQEFAADPEVGERFMREARTMARLKHPRAAMIFDAGRLADGRPFIVMEYVEGATLAEVLAREGTFAPARAVEVTAEICDVLSRGARARHRPPRPQALEHHAQRARRLRARLRHRQGARHLDRGDAHARHHRVRPRHRHAALHVARAVSGPAGRAGLRPLQRRRARLRDARRAPALRGRALVRRPRQAGDLARRRRSSP